jgi:rare lipoprotein A
VGARDPAPGTAPIRLAALALLVAGGLACATPPRLPPGVPRHREVGEASWYGPDFHGRITANGERYNMLGMTAAHRTLPFHTLVEVTNLENGRRVVVRINDRGPFKKGRILDLSYTAARKLGANRAGVIRVRIEVVGRADPSAPSGGSLSAPARTG